MGEDSRPRRAFLVGLGCTVVVAHLSLWGQVRGLFGAAGIVPIASTLDAFRARGLGFADAPSLLWFASGDAALVGLCALGVAAGLATAFLIAPRWALAVASVATLSLVSVGNPFLAFQWDVLLIEATWLGAWYAPGGLRPFAAGRSPAPASPVARLLLAWLVFRLVFGSGLVKLQSGDETWRDGTALLYHYWTQPIPNPLAHLVHHLPVWCARAPVVAMFAVELLAPFLLFAAWRWRRLGAAAIALLMLAFAATGNYGFFQLLALVLLLPLLSRAPWGRPHPVAAVVGLAVLVLGAWRAGWVPLPGPVEDVASAASRLHAANAYGLFADMTESRPEVVVEVSEDGSDWRELRFRWKPGEPDRAPPWLGLEMPRLDWQMWFAALRGAPPSWFGGFQRALLDRSPEVLALLDEPPWTGPAPGLVRAVLYDYRFGTPRERARGLWWERGGRRGFAAPLGRR